MKNNLLSEKLIYTGESQTPTHLHLVHTISMKCRNLQEQTFMKSVIH